MNLLQRIVGHKREEVAAAKRAVRVSELSERPPYGRKAVPMASVLHREGSISIIAEFKRSSPSAGVMSTHLSPAGAGADYASNGASALSVLTDGPYFSGSLDDLLLVREAVDLPLLRKDFIIDEYQIHEAKAFGADAVLLIASILDRPHLADLHAAATGLGLEALVELYDEKEIDLLNPDVMRLIGINNRDLASLSIDLRRTASMAGLLRRFGGITLVSESGVKSPDDLRTLIGSGADAALIGEYFMRSGSPGRALRELLEGVADAAAR